MARPPASLPPTPLVQNETNPLSVSLLLGSYAHSPYSLELFDLYLPPSQSAPEHPDEKTFHPQPEIVHTFRPDQKVPSKFVSGLAALSVAVAPWLLLIGLVSEIWLDCSCFVELKLRLPFQWSQVPISLPYVASPSILPFTLSLTAFEALLFWYWVDLKLGQVLAYGAVLSFTTAVAGKKALEKRGVWRVQGAPRK